MKQNLLETLSAPITGRDVKRVLTTPIFTRKDTLAEEEPPTTARQATLSVQAPPEGLKLEKHRHYELGPDTSLVHLTFSDTIEVVEMLPRAEGASFSVRLWNQYAWATSIQLDFGGSELATRGTLKVLKDYSGRHLYFTVISQSPKALIQHPLEVVAASGEQHDEAEWPQDDRG